MKPENKDLIKALLEHSASLQEDILDDTEQMLGTVPFILQVMARRPQFMIFSSLKDFYALRPQSLDSKIAELLAAAARAGASEDDGPGCGIHRCHHRPDEGAGLRTAHVPGV